VTLASALRSRAAIAALALAVGGVLGGCNAIFGVDDLRYEPSATSAAGGAGGMGASSSSSSNSSSSVGSGGSGGAGDVGGLGGAAGAGGAGGSGGSDPIGCSDGTREWFTNALYPTIAGCSGAWSEPGLTSPASTQPQCGRQAGNDGAIVDGNGCSVADLCAAGWHVCVDKVDVGMRTSACAMFGLAGIWIVRAGGPSGMSNCTSVGVNNLFGCGAGIGTAAPNNCSPLSRELIFSDCAGSSAWQCGGTVNSDVEAAVVTKSSPDEGGVLCCQDP
jgi:hypothetical protein